MDASERQQGDLILAQKVSEQNRSSCSYTVASPRRAIKRRTTDYGTDHPIFPGKAASCPPRSCRHSTSSKAFRHGLLITERVGDPECRFPRPCVLKVYAPKASSPKYHFFVLCLRAIMQLLDFPPEILQQLLLYCTTPSFIQIIYTCRQLFQLADSSRHVLLRHLYEIPGITLGFQELGTHDLFKELRRRGIAHLVGTNIKADRVEYRPELGTFDANASCLSQASMTLALKDSLHLRMYAILGTNICEFQSRLTDSPTSTSDTGKIIRVVARGKAISILFSRVRGLGDDSAPGEDGEVDNKPPDLSETCYYIYHSDMIPDDCTTLYRISAPSLWLGRSIVPIDFAVYSRLQCAVLWDLPGSISPTIFAQVVLYSSHKLSQKPTGYYNADRIWPVSGHPVHEYPPRLKELPRSMRLPMSGLHRLPPEPQPLPRRVRRLMRSSLMSKLPRSISFAYYGKKIKLFAPGEVMPYDVVDTTPGYLPGNEDDPAPEPFLRSATPWTRRISNLDWIMTTPFYASHATYWAQSVSDGAEGREKVEICVMSFLSLATTTVSGQVPSGKDGEETHVVETKILCILSTVDEADVEECTHLADMERCASLRAGHSRVVARLWGWQPSDSSLAGESNLACCDTRIAIADWDRIMVWSLSPKALIDEAHEPTPPPNQPMHNDGDSNDDTQIEGPEAGERRRDPSWTYPKIYDNNMEGWHVELKPIILNPGKGVIIRQLIWKDAHTLLAQTDRGVQVWNLGASAAGRRIQEIFSTDPRTHGSGTAIDGGVDSVNQTKEGPSSQSKTNDTGELG